MSLNGSLIHLRAHNGSGGPEARDCRPGRCLYSLGTWNTRCGRRIHRHRVSGFESRLVHSQYDEQETQEEGNDMNKIDIPAAHQFSLSGTEDPA